MNPRRAIDCARPPQWADALRKDPKIVALLQLRITDISTDVANLTTYFAYMREPLRRLAKEKP